MSKLGQIQEFLQDTGAAIAQTDKAITIDPKSPSLAAVRRSLEKKLRNLEVDFLKAASLSGIDVCSYRLFTEVGDAPDLGSLTRAFGDFQKLVSTVYSAVKGGPKQRATFSAEDAKETAFEFGYAFPGSVGFVLTINNERLLIGETHLDEAMGLIFGMVKAKVPEDIHPFTKQLGSGPVRALYRWALDHVSSGLGADIDWRRGELVRSKMFLPNVAFTELRNVLDKTGEERVEEVTLNGELIAVNLATKTFRMRFDSGDDVHGKFKDAISVGHKVELPKRYTATLTKTSRIIYSREEDEDSYFLLGLEPD